MNSTNQQPTERQAIDLVDRDESRPIENWLEAEILRGFRVLMTMGKKGMPAARDVENELPRIWTRALRKERGFDYARDVSRVREAFRQMAVRCKDWPQPEALLQYMPRLLDNGQEEQPRRPKESRTDAERARGMQHFAVIAAQLGLTQEPQP